jgi:hypothetical protein
MKTLIPADFALGQVYATPTLLEAVDSMEAFGALARHSRCDWGDVCEEDAALNNTALHDGSRLLSVYHDSKGTKFWIITEADRSATTILLPEDY